MATLEELLGEVNQLRAQNETPLSLDEKALGYSRSYLSGPTFGFADNIEAAIAAPFTDLSYDQELASIREQQNRFKEKTDYTDNIVEGVGGVLLNPLGLLGNASKGVGVAKTIGKVASNPVTQGALYGAGNADDGDVTKGALFGGLFGSIGSAAASVGGEALKGVSKQADRLKLSAFGIGYQDVKNQIKKLGTLFASRGDDLPIINTIDKAEKNGIIVAGDTPIDNLARTLGAQEKIAGELKTTLDNLDTVLPAKPDFTLANTMNYINGLSGTAKDQAEMAAAKEYEALIKQIGAGTIKDIQKAKVGLNFKYDKNPYAEDVVKAMRNDLRVEIENRAEAAVQQNLVGPEVAGQVQALNKEWGGLADLRDAFSKKLAKVYGGDVVEDLFGSIATTQGTGSLNIMSAVTGNPLYTVLGAGLNVARMPQGKSNLADWIRTYQKPLQKTGQALAGDLQLPGGLGKLPAPIRAQTVAGITDDITPLDPEKEVNQPAIDVNGINSILSEINALRGVTPGTSSQGTSSPLPQPTQQQAQQELLGLTAPQFENQGIQAGSLFNTSKASNSLFNPQKGSSLFNVPGNQGASQGEDNMYAKQPVKQVIEAVKANPVDHAIALMESDLNPKAKNPTSSAAGLFQLVSKTAKGLGVENVFDAGENYDGYLKLKQSTMDKFDIEPDDYRAIYASHYLGENAFSKWLDGKQLSETQQDQVNYLTKTLFPKLDKFYAKAVKESGVMEA